MCRTCRAAEAGGGREGRELAGTCPPGCSEESWAGGHSTEALPAGDGAERAGEAPEPRLSAFPQILCKEPSWEADGPLRDLLLEVAEPGLEDAEENKALWRMVERSSCPSPPCQRCCLGLLRSAGANTASLGHSSLLLPGQHRLWHPLDVQDTVRAAAPA